MPFADLEAIQPFLPKDHFLLSEQDPQGMTEAFAQADAVIVGFTAAEAPERAADADPLLRHIAAKLAVHFLLNQKPVANENELNYRKTLYTEAMDMLEAIAGGRITPGGSTKPTLQILSAEKRHTEMP